MKKYILFFFITIDLFGICQVNVDIPGTGLPCPIKTISTDPDNYNNSTDLTEAKKWDWRSENYTIYMTGQMGTTGSPVTVVNPYFDQSLNPNTFYLANENTKDFNPADGWELLYKHFGTPNQGISTPYFVLYNKYNGTVRVFANIVNSGTFTYNAAAITLSYKAPTNMVPKRQTAVLNQLGTYSFSMDQMQKDALHFSPNSYTNSGVLNNYFWVYADFYTLFDPCTCGLSSDWFLSIGLISNIDINANVNGTQTTIVDANPSGNNADETAIGTFAGRVQEYSTFGTGIINGLSGVFASANKGRNDGEELIANAYNFTANSANIIGYANAVDLAEILGGIVHNAPNVNFVLNLASSLVTTVKKLGNDFNGLNNPKSTESLGKTYITEVNTELEINGNLTINSPYISNPLKLPGSSSASNQGATIDYLPIYDNILGVLNLFEQPEFKILKYEPTSSLNLAYYHSDEYQGNSFTTPNSIVGLFPTISHLKIMKTPQLLINPASGLKLKTVEYQVVFENVENEVLIDVLKGPIIPGVMNYFEDINVPWFPQEYTKIYQASNIDREKLYRNFGYQMEILVGNDWDSSTISTGYMNQSCFINTGLFSFSEIANPRLRMKVVLEPLINNINSDIDEIIIVHTYPAKVSTELSSMVYTVEGTPDLLYTDAQYEPISINLPIDETNYIFGHATNALIQEETINYNIEAIGDLYIGNNVSFASGNYTIQTSGNIYFNNSLNALPQGCNIEFKAGNAIYVNPEVIISPEVVLTIDPSSVFNCESLPDVVPTSSDIISFCEGEVYNERSQPEARNILITNIQLTNSISEGIDFEFKLFPNPATTNAIVQLDN
jgi:hypothetical protein